MEYPSAAINTANSHLTYPSVSSSIALKTSATVKRAMKVQAFFIAPIHARWEVMPCGSITYCFPIPETKSRIISTPSMAVCVCGMSKYSKIQIEPTYHAVLAIDIPVAVVPVGIGRY